MVTSSSDGAPPAPSPPPPTPFLVALLAGGVAGTVTDIALFPLDSIKTRLQSEAGFVASGGFKGVYRGLLSAAAGSAPAAAAFFSTYEFSKGRLEAMASPEYAPLCHLAAASAGEAVGAVVRVPFEIVKQRMQAMSHNTTSDCVRSIYSSSGVPGFFRGYLSLVVREIPFSAIQFPLYEFNKKRLQEYVGHPLAAWQMSLCGSVAGCVAAALTCPLDVAKTRILLSTSEEDRSIPRVISKIYRNEGWRRLFAGILPRCGWISVGGLVFFGTYEQSKMSIGALLDEDSAGSSSSA